MKLPVLAVSLFAASARAIQWCSPNNAFCFTTTPSSDRMLFELSTKVKGWIAIGFGSMKMEGSDMLVMYHLPNASMVSSRFSNGYSQPSKNKEMVLRRFNETSPMPTDTFTYRFARPLEGDGKRVVTLKNEMMSMIWAYSDKPVTDDNKLEMHMDKGALKINLFQTGVYSASSGPEVVNVVQGALLASVASFSSLLMLF